MALFPGQPASAPSQSASHVRRSPKDITAANVHSVQLDRARQVTTARSKSVPYDVTSTLHPRASHFHLNFASPDFLPGLVRRRRRQKESLHVAFKDDVIAQLSQELHEDVVHPPISRMTIRCPSFAPFEDTWAVTIDKSHPLTIRDVLYSMQKSMHKLVTTSELHMLNKRRSRAVRVTCVDRSKVKHEQPYLARVDFLEGRHYFAGLEWDRERGGRNFKILVKDAPNG